MNPDWQSWLIVGTALSLLEIVVPSTILIWFGLGAIFTAILNVVSNWPLSADLIIWSVATMLFLAVYLELRKEKPTASVGQSDEFLNKKGRVIAAKANVYEVEFEDPVVGASRWKVISKDKLEVGDTVRIIAIEGQRIKVRKEN